MIIIRVVGLNRAKRRQGGDEQEGYQQQEEASQQQHDPRDIMQYNINKGDLGTPA
jgi:hypothetical protein